MNFLLFSFNFYIDATFKYMTNFKGLMLSSSEECQRRKQVKNAFVFMRGNCK